MRAKLRSSLGVVVLALMLAEVGVPAYARAESTPAQRLRAGMSAKKLEELRGLATEIHSDRRWSTEQQGSYLKTCEKTKAKDPSINRRTCECLLEVMMDRYETFGDHVKEVANGGGKPDDQVKTLFGICLVAYGD